MLPFALVLFALIAIVTAARDQVSTMGAALKQDVPPYMKWAAAIVLVGALGLWKPIQVPARLLLALVLVGIFFSNSTNVINSFKNLGQAPTPTTPPTSPVAASESAIAASAGLTGQTIAALEGPDAATTPSASTSGLGMVGLPNVPLANLGSGFGGNSVQDANASDTPLGSGFLAF